MIIPVQFTKYQCCGNDYAFIDGDSLNGFLINRKSKTAYEAPSTDFQTMNTTDFFNSGLNTYVEPDVDFLARLTRFISKRRFGVGADGAVFTFRQKDCDLKIKMFNADGSVGRLCGTALRAAGAIASGIYPEKQSYKIQTDSGIKNVYKDSAYGFIAEIGKADFTIGKEYSKLKTPLVEHEILRDILLTLVSVGNLHAVIFVRDTKKINLEKLYKKIKYSELITSPFNLEVASVTDENNLYVRVFENGSGETSCCGTGACATTATAKFLNLITAKDAVNVTFTGGTVAVKCDQNYFTAVGGKPVKVYDGVFDYDTETERSI